MTTQKLTLQDTVSLEPPGAHDGTAEHCSDIDSLDGLLAELDAGEEEQQFVEEEVTAIGDPKKIPEEYLHTDPAIGLIEHEVLQRRKMYGWNQMREENRSHVKQFLSFFVGPIQFVMEVDLSLTCFWSL